MKNSFKYLNWVGFIQHGLYILHEWYVKESSFEPPDTTVDLELLNKVDQGLRCYHNWFWLQTESGILEVGPNKDENGLRMGI